MLCNFDKASNIRELRRHISLHNNLSVLEDLGSCDVVKRFYPNMDLQEVIPLITTQIQENRFGKLHSIVNANTYEMGISDSNESDSETEYMCEMCVEPFNRKHKLMTHQAYEHTFDECLYKCDTCMLKFTCKQVLDSHLKHHCENPDKEFKCKNCPGRFTWPKNLEKHKCSKKVQIDKEKTICEVCDTIFPTPREMRMHKKSHIPDNKCFDCSICGEKYIRLANLRRHLEMHAEKSNKSLKQKRIQCLLCDAEFGSLRNLKTHIFTHSDGQTNVNFNCCEQFVNNFYPEADETTISEYISSCFKERKLWRMYIAVNKFNHELGLSDSDSDDYGEGTSNDTHVCDLCDLKFPRLQAILRHQHAEHDSKKTSFPHKCDECSDQFVCQALLSRHQKIECKNVDRQHTCVKCGTKYIWKQNLVGHSCKKEDSKKCEVCGKKFIWQKDLHRHKRSHIPEEKKFECLVCGKKLTRKDNLRAHMKIHGPEGKTRPKPVLKWKQQDGNVCRPNGDKCIECKICLVKLNTMRELPGHLMSHHDIRTLKNQEAEVHDISLLLYGKEMDLETLAKAISQDLANGKKGHFYSITNEVGYELSLTDSETGTELDADSDSDDDEVIKRYICSLCNKAFNRKFKIFEHQKTEHSWDELPLECEHCSAKFVCENIYNQHLQQQCENNVKQYKCKRCPLKFTWKDNLRAHDKHIHDNQPLLPKKHSCNTCDKSFYLRKDLLRHKKIHEPEEEHECTWCFRIFMRRDNLKVHMKVHQNATHLLLPDIYYLARPNGIKVAECKHCDEKYTNVSELRAHIRGLHLKFQKQITTPAATSYSITNALGYEMDIEDSETEKEDPTEKYFCELCDARFNRRFKLLKHQQALHYSDNIPHKCNMCNFKCVSEAVLSYHMRTQCMNEMKQYRCTKCTMRFMWQENLENHESLIHDSPRTHTCDVCKRDFATQHDLKSHSECKPPTEVKFYECSLCDRKYNRKDRLQKHVKTHDGESKESLAKLKQPTDKKYLCAFCGKEVSSSSNLVIHMRRHTGEKPFKCEFCNKGFPRSSDLSCHRRTHTGERPHKCTVCDKAFSRSYKLQTHMRIHSGEKPYKCTYCDKSFTQSNDLTLHVRRHTGERPYICETCGERFIQGTALRNHRRMRGHYEI